MSVENITVKFDKDRDTKHTTRYSEVIENDSKPQVIGTLYVQKWFAGGADRLEVTITKGDA